MPTTTLSTKGQIIIPKEVRERHGWAPGLALEIVDQGDSLVLRPVSAVPATTVDDLLGCLPHAGPAKTLEEMEAGIARGARRHALPPARRTVSPGQRPAVTPRQPPAAPPGQRPPAPRPASGSSSWAQASMISLDTNIVVRVITRDDPAQARRAAAIMKGNALWLSKTVLLEIEWVLRYTYGYDAPSVHRALTTLAGLRNLTLEDAPAVLRALDWHEEGMDFADALHLASSAAAAKLVTFDRRLARSAARVTGAVPVDLLET